MTLGCGANQLEVQSINGPWLILVYELFMTMPDLNHNAYIYMGKNWKVDFLTTLLKWKSLGVKLELSDREKFSPSKLQLLSFRLNFSQ